MTGMAYPYNPVKSERTSEFGTHEQTDRRRICERVTTHLAISSSIRTKRFIHTAERLLFVKTGAKKRTYLSIETCIFGNKNRRSRAARAQDSLAASWPCTQDPAAQSRVPARRVEAVVRPTQLQRRWAVRHTQNRLVFESHKFPKHVRKH